MLAVFTPFLWVDWGKGWFNLQGKKGLTHLCAKLQETRSVYTDRKYRKIQALTWLDAAHPVWS